MYVMALFAMTLQAQNYQISRAQSLIENEEYKEAAMLLRPLAENGNAEAQYMVSKLFAEGNGVIKSQQQAERYLKLAANGGYVQAMEDYSDKAYIKKDYATAYKWMKAAYDKEPTQYRAFCIGSFLYWGHGVKGNKVEGWKMMKNNQGYSQWEKKEMGAVNYDYFCSLIDGCINDPEAMRKKIEDEYRTYIGKEGWIDTVANYIVDQLKALPDSIKSKQFNIWSERSGSISSVFITAMMYENGIGTARNHQMAYKYATVLYAEPKIEICPNIKNIMESIIGNIEKGQIILGKYIVTDTNGDNVTFLKDNISETMSVKQIIAEEVRLQQKQEERKRRMTFIKVSSTAPQINVINGNVTHQSCLRVYINIRLKAANKCKFNLYGGTLKLKDGTIIKGYSTVSGLSRDRYEKDMLRPGDAAIVCMTFTNVPAEGEAENAYCTVSTDYGMGIVSAEDFAF